MFTLSRKFTSHLALISVAAIVTACATQQENPHYQHSTKFKGDSPNTALASNTTVGTSSNAYTSANTGYTQASTGHTQVNSYGHNAASASPAYHNANHSYIVESTPPVYSESNYTHQANHFVITPQANQPQATYGTHEAPSYSRISAECVNNGQQGAAGCLPTSVPLTTQNASIAAPFYGQPQTLYVTSETTQPISPTESTMPDSYGTPGYEAMKNAETGFGAYAGAAPQIGQAVPMTEPFASPIPEPTSRSAVIQPVRSQPIITAPQNTQAVGIQYEVQEGDTVYSFSRKLCTSVEDIRAMNGLDSSYGIQLGQTLRLPNSRC